MNLLTFTLSINKSVTYKTDLLTGNTGNFNIMEIIGLSDKDITNDHHEDLLVASFTKGGTYTLAQFIAFATTWGLGLIRSESNGNNSTVLVIDGDDSESWASW